MEMGEDPPVIFQFELPAVDEKGIGSVLGKMDSIKKVISVEETEKPIDEEYKPENN